MPMNPSSDKGLKGTPYPSEETGRQVESLSLKGFERSPWVSLKSVFRLLIIVTVVMTFVSPQFLPFILIGYLGLILLLGLIQLGMKMRSKKLSAIIPHKIHPEFQPFVSVHLPIYNEPPEVVIETLKSLQNMNYQNFEVVVLDNNTENPDLWWPVKHYCHLAGENIRFFHVDKLKGYKAGALNLCMLLADTRAKYFAVVDADYCVDPNFLVEAVSTMKMEDYAFIQFPQAYQESGGKADAVYTDFSEYFECTLRAADITSSPFPTGTLSFFRRSPLEHIGGWQSQTITEDAEMGLRLKLNGYSGCYVHKLAGRGQIPNNFSSLRSQRRRWIFGNSQCLFSLSFAELYRLGWNNSLSAFLQLTAWFQFLLFPVLVSALASIAYSMGFMSHSLLQTVVTLAMAVVLALFMTSTVIFLVFVSKTHSIGEAIRAYAIRLSLFVEGNVSWWEAPLGFRLPFIRTCKFKKKTKWSSANLQVGVISVLLSLAAYFQAQGFSLSAAILSITAVIHGLSVIYCLKALGSIQDLKITSEEAA